MCDYNDSELTWLSQNDLFRPPLSMKVVVVVPHGAVVCTNTSGCTCTEILESEDEEKCEGSSAIVVSDILQGILGGGLRPVHDLSDVG